MKKIIFLIIYLLLITRGHSAIVNCIGGECEFKFSTHYDSAKTFCNEIITNENVETNYSFFLILRNGKKCEIYDEN